VITPNQYERAQALQPSAYWTRYVHQGYPPAAQSKVVVAWDPVGGCWVLAYDTVETMPNGAHGLTTARFLKTFYCWRGMGSIPLPPGPLMVQWLREHDCFAESYVGEWSDKFFARVDRARAEEDEKKWQEEEYRLKQLYHRHKDEIQGKFGYVPKEGPAGERKFFYEGCLG